MNRVALLSGLGLALSLAAGACTAPSTSPTAANSPSALPAASQPAASAPAAVASATPAAIAEPDAKAVFAKFKAQPDAFMKVSMEGGIPSDFHGGSFHYFVSKEHAAGYKNLKGMAPEGMMVIKQSTTDATSST
jgi:hypothetical protein